MVALKRGTVERAWRQTSRAAIEEMIALEASASVALDNDPDYQTFLATPETARWDRINKLVAAEAAAIKGRTPFAPDRPLGDPSAASCALAACRPGRCDYCGAYGPTHILSLYSGGHGYRVTSFCCPDLAGAACDARQTAGQEARR